MKSNVLIYLSKFLALLSLYFCKSSQKTMNMECGKSPSLSHLNLASLLILYFQSCTCFSDIILFGCKKHIDFVKHSRLKLRISFDYILYTLTLWAQWFSISNWKKSLSLFITPECFPSITEAPSLAPPTTKSFSKYCDFKILKASELSVSSNYCHWDRLTWLFSQNCHQQHMHSLKEFYFSL